MLSLEGGFDFVQITSSMVRTGKMTLKRKIDNDG
jgi:hypothetical protein